MSDNPVVATNPHACACDERPSLLIKYLDNYASDWPRLGYVNPGDAGFDLRAAIGDSVRIGLGDRTLIRTGVKMAIPAGFELQIRPRSGLAVKNGVTVLNTPGTIDAGYRGEIGVILINHSNCFDFWVNPGDRIAQGVLAAVAHMPFAIVDELPDSERGADGFGSTGRA